MLLLCLTWSALIMAQPVAPQDEPEAEFACSGHTCFAVSWIGRRFAKAKGACNEKTGTLMAVRSAVQADAIAALMARVHKEDARVWIGLEQKDGSKCTDLQQTLRGFTWVTGDNHTDYTNWRNDGQKCGALCVTVRKDGTWEEAECDSKADGYLCEISYPALCPLVLPSFFSVTYSHFTLGKCHQEGTVWPPGTIAEISTDPDITRLSCEEKGDGTVAWGRETPGAWSCVIGHGGCEEDCVEDSGIAECRCPPGSDLKSDQRGCTKPCHPGPCNEHHAPDPEGLLHTCPGGYTPAADGETCEDMDECADHPYICEDQRLNTICRNTDGGYTCDCKPGFELGTMICDGEDKCVTHCHIIDECDNHMCEQACESYPGGHRCVCHQGFAIDENNQNKCKLFCNTSSCKADCSKGTECMCPHGYILEHTDNGGKVCNDVDECAGSVCHWLCKNTFGSFICTCPEGYTMDNGECIQPTRSPSEIIMDTPSPTSTCPEGYTMDNGECIQSTRSPSEIILDTPSPTSTCPEGYTMDNGECIQSTRSPSETILDTPSPASKPTHVYSLQPVIMWGICSGLLSILIVLIVMLSHRMRKHYIYQHDLDYNYKNADKDVVLKKIIMEPQWRL